MTEDKPLLVTRPPAPLADLRTTTEARIALGRSGAGLPTHVAQTFLLDHAQAREAVWSALDVQSVEIAIRAHDILTARAQSDASDRAEYLRRPDLGRRLAKHCEGELAVHHGRGDVAIVVSDGLSATAVEANAVPVIAALLPLLDEAGFTLLPVVIATQARVALGDDVGAVLGAEAVVMLIGERPGLSAADSLGAYLTYRPKRGLPDSSRNCISNIRNGGLSCRDAAQQIRELLCNMRAQATSGITLKLDAEKPERLLP